MTVSKAADRGLDARFGQSLGVANGQILTATVAMVGQSFVFCRAAYLTCLIQSIQGDQALSEH